MAKFPHFSIPKRATGEAQLVLDIGTDSAKALVYEDRAQDGKQITVIHGIGRTPLMIGDFQQEMITRPEGVKEACIKAIADAEKASGAKTKRMYLSIGGNFIRGETTTFNYTRVDSRTKIELNELKNAFQKLHWKAVERIRAKMSTDEYLSKGEVKIVHALIQDVKIDGYPVENPIGLKGKIISFTVFHTFLSLVNFDIVNGLTAAFSKELVALYQPSYAVFRVMKRKGGDGLQDFILVDIGGSVTELALSRKGMLVGIKEFAIGGRALSKRIARELGIGFWEAEHIKLHYNRSEVSAYVAGKISRMIERDLVILESGVEISLKELALLNILPPKLFVYGGGSNMGQLQELFKKSQTLQNLPFAEPPELTFMSTADLGNIEVKDANFLSDPSWVVGTAIAKDALYAGDENIMQRTLRTIMNVMCYSI